jgi:hypothetical protein
VCDGQSDCRDASDERKCGKLLSMIKVSYYEGIHVCYVNKEANRMKLLKFNFIVWWLVSYSLCVFCLEYQNFTVFL